MSISWPSFKEAILKIACYYYQSGKTQLPIKTAESRSYSSERDELIKKMKNGLRV